jgi:aspartyl-tRNA(Asn)/glutamyl-tRNA(Gln) amidotransferase subunit A
MKLEDLTIKSAAESLRKKEFSATELAQEHLSKIKSDNKKYSAFLGITENLALKQAKEADNLLADGKEKSPLLGIPLAIKDNILVADETCTAGAKILEKYKAVYDATVTRKLKDAGAVFLGKTNLDEFAMGASTENSGFGPSKNPHDTSRVPGGSSGGSAAALAADMVLGALGSDTGGSIRQPASFCGVYGLRPTYGRVSRYGLIAMASSLDQVGPFGKTAHDTALLFENISGKDEHDSTSAEVNLFRVSNLDQIKLKGMKIGLPKEYFIEGLDPKVKAVIDKSIKKLEDLGAKLEEISLPHTKYAIATYYIIVPCEVSANLARFDGIRYGLSDREGKTLQDIYFDSKKAGFGEESKRRIILGTFALSHGYYDAYYLKAQKVRTKISEDFQNAFKQVDLIATPTTPTTAFKLREKADDPLAMYLADIFTASAPLAGIPALSVPAGQVDNLPVGLQLMAGYFEEAKILKVAQELEQL